MTKPNRYSHNFFTIC